MLSDLSIQMITWNVKEEQCHSDLTQLLGIETTGANGHQLADIYAIGLQEVPFETINTEIPTEHTWAKSFNKVLEQVGYSCLEKVQMNGVVLLVFAKSNKLSHFTSVQLYAHTY
ncbi:unnamed protein product [Oppiella nova]|uniref:Inositol polyphosphate-related phosphatase domain-containing protein n=1 Tax=Oppiella nova TaxID=334625 RepID=A0A7R9QUA3_9ACAR|nr:unnamed protein product [Oppiella nova]CAG2174296.1 unnamed protein product [Oppiella nova]